MIRQIANLPTSKRARENPSSLRRLLAPLASLRLTVVLLALTMILVFTGTSVQKEMGIWDVQHRFFHSFFVWIDLHLFFPLWNWGFAHVPGRIPMLGGYSIIALLLINLLAAHSVRFSLSRKRMGIILIHGGLILLILGEVITSLFAVETRMYIREGQTARYSEDMREPELAVIDPSPAQHDDIIAIRLSRFAKTGAAVDDARLPFSIHVDQFFANSQALGPIQLQRMNLKPDARATAGSGIGMTVIDAPKANGTEEGRIDQPAAYVTLARDGQNLGTYLVTTATDEAQDVDVNGQRYQIAMRWRRYYKPYTLTVHKVSHDVYTGSSTPKNYASLVQLVDPSRNENRQVKIWMNHPLRYAGETFYQADLLGEHTTVLQVVRNPGWLIPYISCALVALGLLIHFGRILVKFLDKTVPSVHALPKPNRPSALWPAIVTAFCLLFVVAQGQPPKHGTEFDLNAFGKVPISFDGRVMPLDTLARISLRIISNKSEVHTDDGRSQPAILWLANTMSQNPVAHEQKIFRIDQPDVIGLLGLSPDRALYSFDEIMTHAAEIDAQIERIQNVPDKHRDAFQVKLLELNGHLGLFMRLQEGADLYLAPPTGAGAEWQTLADAASTIKMVDGKPESMAGMNPGLAAYWAFVQSYRQDQPADFNDAVHGYLDYISRHFPDVSRGVRFETLFNYVDPFMNCCALYIVAFLFVCAGWLIRPVRGTLLRCATCVLLFTFVFHTAGLIGRIYIQGRPPVTNLYSSAIFIGWVCVGFCLAIEYLLKDGTGSFAACAVAFPTLVIAHYLAVNPALTPTGDTMEMMRAVLDTNIWLATHVVVVTMGYSATMLAGVIASYYIIGRVCFGWFQDASSRKTMGSIIYGVLCFALLFSFVGTVLGGIWADQSWGRFWGWDPKENGAVLIVLWNAIVLHARWAGIVRTDRGMINLAVLGNIVTAWSWFGTNMMGVGLHSYGFMTSAVSWLSAVVALHLAIFAAGLLPVDQSITREASV